MKVSSAQLSRGKEIPLTSTYMQGKAMRWEMTINGMTSYGIITQTNGWRFSPTSGSSKSDAMTAAAVKEAQSSLNICGSLMDYKAQGIKSVYYGTDDVEGAECHKVKLTFPTGKEQTYYFDAETYYVFRIVEKTKVDGKETSSGTNYYNFKKLPEGIVYAMSLKNDRGGPISVKSVEINKPVDESIFVMKN